MREPRQQISVERNTSQTFQLFGVDVEGLAPDTPVIVDATALGFPRESLAQVPAGEYTVQAVLNVYETFHRKDGHVIKAAMDRWEGQHWNTKPGNLYSEPRACGSILPTAVTRSRSRSTRRSQPLPEPKETQIREVRPDREQAVERILGPQVRAGRLRAACRTASTSIRTPTTPSSSIPHTSLPASTPSPRLSPDPDPTRGTDKIAAEVRPTGFYQDWTSGKMPAHAGDDHPASERRTTTIRTA